MQYILYVTDRLCVKPNGRNDKIHVYNYGSVDAAGDRMLLWSDINGWKSERISSSVINIFYILIHTLRV